MAPEVGGKGRPYGLQEKLAVERTLLANERTTLNYVQTALALFVTGASMVQFFQMRFARWAGAALGIAAAATLVLGLVRHARRKAKLLRVDANAFDPDED